MNEIPLSWASVSSIVEFPPSPTYTLSFGPSASSSWARGHVRLLKHPVDHITNVMRVLKRYWQVQFHAAFQAKLERHGVLMRQDTQRDAFNGHGICGFVVWPTDFISFFRGVS